MGKLRARPARLMAARQTRLTIAALVACLISSLVSDARAQEILRWKLKAGDALKYSIEQKTVMNVKLMGKDHKQTRTHTIDYDWSVKDVSPNGDAEITLKIDHLRMKVEAPPYMPFEYDSKAPKGEVPEPFEAEVQQLKATIGAEFSFKMKPSGEIEDIKIPEPTLKKLRDALPQEAAAQAALSEQVLKEMLMQSSAPPFPRTPLEVGKNWTSKPSKLTIPSLGTLVTEKVFTFQGPDPKNPKLMLIGMEGRVTLEPAENVAARIRSQEGKGSLIFDADAGHIVNSRLTQKTDMAMSVMGQEIEQMTETTSTMALIP
jgi:hypothetical protein